MPSRSGRPEQQAASKPFRIGNRPSRTSATAAASSERAVRTAASMDGFVDGASAARDWTATWRWATTTSATSRSTGTSPTSTCSSTASSARPRGGSVGTTCSGSPGPRATRRTTGSRRTASATLPTIFDRLEAGRRLLEVLRPELRPADHLPHRSASATGLAGRLGAAARLRALPRRPEALQAHRRPRPVLHATSHNGTLPAVAYIAPSGSSEHPPGQHPGRRGVRADADQRADARARYWKSSAFTVVLRRLGRLVRPRPPPQVDEFGYGFRVPALLVSPYAQAGLHRPHDARLHVDAEVHRGELGPGAARSRDAHANEHHGCVRLLPDPAVADDRGSGARGQAAGDAEAIDRLPLVHPRFPSDGNPDRRRRPPVGTSWTAGAAVAADPSVRLALRVVENRCRRSNSSPPRRMRDRVASAPEAPSAAAAMNAQPARLRRPWRRLVVAFAACLAVTLTALAGDAFAATSAVPRDSATRSRFRPFRGGRTRVRVPRRGVRYGQQREIRHSPPASCRLKSRCRPSVSRSS